jgi:hypothetical protein
MDHVGSNESQERNAYAQHDNGLNQGESLLVLPDQQILIFYQPTN